MILDALTFDEGAHAYAWDGNPVPSVTQVLARLTDYASIPPEVLAMAAARGKAVHHAVELDVAEDLDEEDLHEEVRGRLAGWRAFRQALNFRPMGSEVRVYSRRHGYAGTLDLWGYLRGVPTVIDVKATYAIPEHVGIQLAAYAQALNESYRTGPLRRGVLHLERQRWQFVPCTRSLDFQDFLAELHHHRSNPQ